MEPLAAQADILFAELLGPLGIPRHFVAAARFGLKAIQPATMLARRTFAGAPARALFAGLAAHAILPLERWSTSAVGLVLGIAGHAVGWPVVRGGLATARRRVSRLILLRSVAKWSRAGGFESVDELPEAKAVLLDLTPRQLVRLAGHRLPAGYLRRLGRYRYGMGVFKLDWALNAPIPWRSAACVAGGNRSPRRDARGSRRQRGGRFVEASYPARPFVLLSQPSLFDPTRAPAGQHTAWAYCHVPHGSTVDMSGPIESQVERFAPGFRDTILARHAMAPADFRVIQRELHRRRYQRRLAGHPPALHSAGGAARPVFDALAGPLSLLIINPSRRRRARTLRLPCRARRVETDFEFRPQNPSSFFRRLSIRLWRIPRYFRQSWWSPCLFPFAGSTV